MTTTEHTVPPEDLMAYVDGELSPVQTAAIEAHVVGCRACQATVTELRQVSRDLAQWSIEAPPPRSAPHVRTGLRQWLHALMALQFKPVAQVATVAIVLVAGTFVWVESQLRKTPLPSFAAASDESLGGAGGGGNRPAKPGAAPARSVMSSPTEAISVGGQAAATVQTPGPAAEGRTRSHIIRTAVLTVVTKDFDAVRPAIDRVLQEAGGFVGHIQVSGGRGNARTLTATLRVPAARLDAMLVSLRALGQVMDESQGGEDVTTQLFDQEARLRNSRNTENRLTEVLKRRTGNVRDVLEVEREIARVRGEIEQLDAQQKQLQDRVSYATVSLTISEERQARLDTGTVGIGTQLRNAFVEGMQNVYESAAGALLTVLRVAPVLTFWVVVLWWPLRRAVRVMRRTAAAQTSR